MAAAIIHTSLNAGLLSGERAEGRAGRGRLTDKTNLEKGHAKVGLSRIWISKNRIVCEPVIQLY